MTHYKLLSSADAAPFVWMTFPAYRHLLSFQPSPRHTNEIYPRLVQPVAIGATASSEPAGLVLAELPAEPRDTKAPELLSLFVAPGFRRQGIGTSLLQELQVAVRESGFDQMTTVYMTGKPDIEFFERILRRCSWEPPVTRMICVRFDLEALQQAPWLQKYELEPDYEIFPWVELTAEEREALKQSQETDTWIAEDLLPWEHEKEPIEPRTSLGLRYKGKVVGWVINHPLSEDTIRATCSYIHKSLGRLGRLVPVYAESFRRAFAAGFSEGMFTTPLQHRGMVNFARRRFVPWATFFGETKGAVKFLRQSGPADRNP